MNKAGTILSEQTALDLLFALPFAAFESASSAVVLALQYLQSNPLAQVELTIIKSLQVGSFWLVHQQFILNPTKYEDPLTFNPWRWKGRELNAGSKFFMGFGSVVRLCAGAEFVKLQISIFLHHLVTNYRWTVIKEGKAVGQPGLVFPDGFHVQILNKKFI
ncbi:hypothetical protein Goklo_009668 [Gossypium klotzschianum]|uniref:Cytochrome P450 n=1 Tax=Gossypium klotzschianum TaxID=34286 RepID=A0A7J8V3Q1_9ROSI|nr:hypothetical protein [Gossypium klotzschianum]MBA0657382.1 hypothetical protein [Gossypium klotzschianum]